MTAGNTPLTPEGLEAMQKRAEYYSYSSDACGLLAGDVLALLSALYARNKEVREAWDERDRLTTDLRAVKAENAKLKKQRNLALEHLRDLCECQQTCEEKKDSGQAWPVVALAKAFRLARQAIAALDQQSPADEGET